MKPATAPPASVRKPRLVFEDANAKTGEDLVCAALPKLIELRVDGAVVWALSGHDLPKRHLAEALLRLRVAMLTDAEVAALEEA